MLYHDAKRSHVARVSDSIPIILVVHSLDDDDVMVMVVLVVIVVVVVAAVHVARVAEM